MRVYVSDLDKLAKEEQVDVGELVCDCFEQGITHWFIDIENCNVIYGESKGD